MNRTLLIFAMMLFSAGAPAQEPNKSNQITVGFVVDASTMDPFKYTGGADREYLSQVYETSVRPDPNLKRINWLAETWEIAKNEGKPVLEVKLREGVRFHNGYPLTSADFEFAYQRARDPKISRYSFLQDAVEKFEIVDDLRFRIHFSRPDAQYLAENLTLWAISKRYHSEVGEEKFSTFPIGTGSWKFVSRRIGEEFNLRRNDDYWNKQYLAGAEFLTIKIIPDDTTRLAAFKTGAIDWIQTVPGQALGDLGKLSNVKVISLASGGHPSIQFASHIPDSPFKDFRVRLAVAHAIDWDAIVKTVLFGQGRRYVELAPEDFGYDPDLKPYPYDPAKARQLLAEANFARGFTTNCFNLVTPREPNFKEMGEAVFAYLGAVGIRCSVKGVEYGAWLNTMRRDVPPEMDGIFMMSYGVGVPGDLSRAWYGMAHTYVPGTSIGLYAYTTEPELDQLVVRQSQTLDLDERARLIREIAKMKRDRILGGLTTYVPMKTFAWRTDRVDFTPWPWPGNWADMLAISLRK